MISSNVYISLLRSVCPPSELVTDFGSQFVNDLLVHFHQETGINYHATIPYCKEENGIVVRANKEANRHLRNILFDLDPVKLVTVTAIDRTDAQQCRETTTRGFTKYTTIWLLHLSIFIYSDRPGCFWRDTTVNIGFCRHTHRTTGTHY